MKRNFLSLCAIFFLGGVALAACGQQATPASIQDVPASEASATVAAPLESTATAAAAATLPAPASSMPEIPLMPSITPVLIGTPIAHIGQEIGLSNLDRLGQVAQWGKGSILSVAFAPDGRSFVAGTPFGLTVYNVDDLSAPPRWLHFDNPFVYEKLYFSNDGKYVLLSGSKAEQTRLYATGEAVNVDGVVWLKPQPNTDHEYDNVSVASPAGTRIFTSSFGTEPDNMTVEVVTRQVTDGSGNLLYTLTDNVPQLTYEDRVEPEGCDLGVFSPCGNALMPLARAPERVEFSPDGNVIAVLYGVPSLFHSTRYGSIRVYNASDGKFIMSLGSRAKPPVDFAFSPDSQVLLVGYMEGSVERWRMGGEQPIFGARHMSAAIDYITYSNDGKYLLIQRMNELEVRQTSDGSMLARYDAATFAISPVDNLVAIGGADGVVHIRRIDSGEKVVTIQAHSDLIYSLAFSSDGRYLASGGRDCKVKLWDATSGKFLHYFEETRLDPYQIDWNSRTFTYYMRFIPGSDTLVGFGSWGTTVAWSVNSGATKYSIESAALDLYTVKPQFPEFFGVDVAKNVFYINQLSYDLNTGAKIGEYTPPGALPEGCAPSGPVSKDKKVMFTIGYKTHDGQICVLDAQNSTLLKTIDVVAFEQDSYILDWLYLSPNGQQLIVTTGNGLIYVYEPVS